MTPSDDFLMEWTMPVYRSRPVLSSRLIGSAVALLLAACAGSATDDPQATDIAVQVEALRLGVSDVAEVVSSAITGGVQLSGPLEAATSVVVKAQVDGTIGTLTVDRGSQVSRGQTLLTIEGNGLVEQQTAAHAAVASAQADLAVADQNLAAAQKLTAAGAMAPIELKAAEAQQRGALARLEAARAQERVAGVQVGHAAILAPITGAVSERLVEVGQAVRNGDPMLTLVDPRVLELRGRISVNEAGLVRIGQAVVFAIDGMSDQSLTGTIARIDPAADPGTRQVGVYARLNNANRRIVAGQYAHGRIALTSQGGAEALVVPSGALRGPAEARYVFVLADGKAQRRAVTTGQTDPATGLTVIVSGLAAGERVLATGAVIADGAPIQLPDAVSGKEN